MLETWCFILMIFYTIPCFIIYSTILIQFSLPSMKKDFNGAFFKISTVIGVSDLIYVINSFPDYKMPLCPLFSKFYSTVLPGFWINIIRFLDYYTIYIKEYLLVMIAVNRFTAIKSPHKHNYVRFFKK